VESLAGGLFGGAGAEIDNTITAVTSANIGNNVFIKAKEIIVEAINHVDKWMNQANIEGEAGGLISVGGGDSDTTISLSTLATIGDGANLETVASSSQGDLILRTLNDLKLKDKVILQAAGGLGSGVKASATTTAETDLARVDIGAATLKSAGKVVLSARAGGSW